MTKNKIIFSPHFDDACLSAFSKIDAQTIVVTVFSSGPKREISTSWDRYCGFKNSTEAIAERRRENELFIKKMGCKKVDLGFIDHQYNIPMNKILLANALINLLKKESNAIVYAPLATGGFMEHPDHTTTMTEVTSAVKKLNMDLYYFADLPYFTNSDLKWTKVKNSKKKLEACKIYKSQIYNLINAIDNFELKSLKYEAYLKA